MFHLPSALSLSSSLPSPGKVDISSRPSPGKVDISWVLNLLLGIVVGLPIWDISKWLFTRDKALVSYQTDFCELRNVSEESWVLEPWSTASSLVGFMLMLYSWRHQARVNEDDGSVNHKNWAIFCTSFFCGTIYHGTGATLAVLGSFLVGSFFANMLVGASQSCGFFGEARAKMIYQALWVIRLFPFLAKVFGGEESGWGVSVAHVTLILITFFTATVTLTFIGMVLTMPGINTKIKRHAMWSTLLGVKDSMARFEPILCDQHVGLGIAYHVFFHVTVAWSVTHMCLLVDELGRSKQPIEKGQKKTE